MQDTKEKNILRNHRTNNMVGMGEIKLLQGKGGLWAVLGSCVGLVMYDAVSKTGGIAHVMLQKNGKSDANPGKYADTAVPALLQLLLDNGAVRRRIKARLIGGANMFKWKSSKNCLSMGMSNAEAVKEVLKAERIPVIKCVIGGNTGYKIRFSASDGTIYIRFIDGRTMEI